MKLEGTLTALLVEAYKRSSWEICSSTAGLHIIQRKYESLGHLLREHINISLKLNIELVIIKESWSRRQDSK